MSTTISTLLHYLSIAGSTATVYLFIVACIHVFGKTEVAQLSITDFVFIMLISNAVQNAMVGPDASLGGGLVAATTLFVMDSLFKHWLYRFPRFAKTLQGSPLTLVRHGRLQKNALKEAMLTQDELMEALREHGADKLSDIDMAILESDGTISVLSDQFKTQSTRKKQPRRPAKKH
ncbi:MAG: DUF421 domain-containing protein [Atopobiaceae bacterium]|jgi:uncharacterized membrane protein YcaP (DUF421 family)|nr:DUF421 domain-containing protein [Atopobiaceae bacterium]